VNEQGIAIAAVLGACLIVAILALAAVTLAMGLMVYRRFNQTESQMVDDLAGRVIAAWQSGSDTRRDMVRDIEAETTIEAETRIRRQHFRKPAESLRDAMEADEPVTVATFGQAPMMPEMVGG